MSVLVAFDTETTGLDPATEGIAELAAVKRAEDGSIVEWAELMKPHCPMSEGAGKVNGLTDEMLASKPRFAELLSSFMEFIGDAILIGHNSQFDVDFLAHEIMRVGGQLPANSVLDTLPMARFCYPGFRNHKLGTMVAELKLPSRTAHRALTDSYSALDLYDACVAKTGIEKTASLTHPSIIWRYELPRGFGYYSSRYNRSR